MKAQAADEETKQQMQQMLQRFYEQTNDEEEDEAEDIADRLNGIDLEDESALPAIWGSLNEAEKEEFLELVDGQQIDDLIKPWVPWWRPQDATAKIVPIDEEGQRNTVPSIRDIGTPVQKLTKKMHPSVLFQIVQISLGYVYMMRHLNGDPYGNDLAIAFEDITNTSPLLTSKTADIYESTQEALVTAFISIDQDRLPLSARCALLDDIIDIYSNPDYVCSMLSDIYTLIERTQSSKPHHRQRNHLMRAEKRLYFLLSVCLQMCNDKDAWRFMVADITIMRRRYESEDQDIANVNAKVCDSRDNNIKTRADIEETLLDLKLAAT